MVEPGRCPVCQARFRSTRICSRCGADLKPLMLLTALAWKRRQDARQAIADGDFFQAASLAQQAQELQRTSSGAALMALCDILKITEAGVRL